MRGRETSSRWPISVAATATGGFTWLPHFGAKESVWFSKAQYAGEIPLTILLKQQGLRRSPRLLLWTRSCAFGAWGGTVSKPELPDRRKRGLRETSAVCRAGRSAVLLLLLSLGVSPLPTRGQGTVEAKQAPKDLSQLSLEELMNLKVDTVYGASKFEQKVTEAPSSITIITTDEIQKYGYRTLADLLRSVPGFYVSYDRQDAYIGVRGISRPSDYNTLVLTLIDGHRVNENVFDGTYVDGQFVLDVDLVDRVEIIRGPGSSLYGTDAFFAVINIITKRGRDLKGT